MAARSVARTFDYAAIAAKLPQEVKGDFAKMVSTASSLKESLNKYGENPPAIDWAKYRSSISSAGVVETAEKGYSSLSFPRPEDTKTAKISAKRAEMVKAAKAEADASENRIKSLQGQLASIHAEKGVTELTAEEVLRDNPQWKAEIEADLKNYKWAP